MSKYIIEIKPEYEDSFKGLMILGAKDSNLFVDTLAVEDLEELNSDYISEHFGDLQDTAYQKGFEKGKDVRIKGCEGCMYQDTTIEHNPCNLCCNAFLNRWTAKDDKIEVGDEVTAYNELIRKEEHFVVIEVGGYFGEGNVGLFVLYGNDKSSVDFKAGCFSTSAKDVTKTGRHFDIQSILEAMRHD